MAPEHTDQAALLDRTFASLTLAQAKHQVGRDAIIRDDPMFGRRGRVHAVVPDERCGFTVCVLAYKKTRVRGRWEVLDKPGDFGRAYWAPEKVELT